MYIFCNFQFFIFLISSIYFTETRLNKTQKCNSLALQKMSSNLIGTLLFSFGVVSESTSVKATYETRYYNQTLDHVSNFDPSHPKWSHRYLINDDNWGSKKLSSKCQGPILMYAGNEAPVTGISLHCLLCCQN